MTDERYSKIAMTTLDDGTWVETPWANPLGENRYRLCNALFCAHGVSCGDVVETRSEPVG